MKMTITQFKKYYEEYYQNLPLDKDKIDDLMNTWKYYKDKIDNKSLTPIEYNSKKENFNDNSYSLQYFIERGSNYLASFGQMISGKLVLWVEGVSPNLIYHDCTNNDKSVITESESNLLLNVILDYLSNLFANVSIDDVDSYMNSNSLTLAFGSKAFLEKMIIFNSWTNTNIKYKLIFIHNFSKSDTLEIIDKDNINVLDFLNDNSKSNLNKNYLLTSKLLEILGMDNPSIYDLAKLGWCYWELTGSIDRNTILNDDYKNIIYYGPPGTGKTYAVKKALSGNDNIVTKFVQFHPGFTYEDFIEGIKPCSIDDNGNLKFSIVNGVFKQFCIDAVHDKSREYYFVADEINRANLSSVFGETLSLLEDDYKYDIDASDHMDSLCQTPLGNVIKRLYLESKSLEEKKEIEKLIFTRDNNGDVLFGIPKNVHFIGMMNDVDKSIDTFDLALRRRFVWIRKGFEERPIRLLLMDKGVSNDDIYIYLKRCERLNYFITGYKYDKNLDVRGINNSLNLGINYELGHAIFMKIKVDIGKRKINLLYDDLFDKHISTTLKEYLRTSLSEIDIDNNLLLAKSIFTGNNEI